jgi:hypothetical protein
MWFSSIRRKFLNHESSGLSFGFMWDAVGNADVGCKVDIHDRLRMGSAVPHPNWAHERWRWLPN